MNTESRVAITKFILKKSMIDNFIKWALRNRVVVLLIAVAVAGYGFYSVNNTIVDNYTLSF